MKGRIRNYVERFFREFKRQTKVFDTAFPQKKPHHHSIHNWVNLFAWHYNQNLDTKGITRFS